MRNHIRLLALCYFIYGAMGSVALMMIAAVTLIGSGLAGMDDPRAGLILGSIGSIGVLIAALASLPNLFAGYGLIKYRSWGRIVTLVLSILNLFAFPVGTVLGGYGLWVLFQAETVELFRTGGLPHPMTSGESS